MADSLSLQAEAQLKLRVRREKEALRERYDWYGPPCKCPIPAGECKEHPVDHCGCEGVKAGKCPDHPVDPCGCTKPLGHCSLHHRARPEQRPPETPWRHFVLCAGRAAGKTRAAAEYVTWCVENRKVKLIALVGESVKDVRTVMIEGPSGLGSPDVARPWMIVDYEPSKAQVRWYDRETNEELAVATIYSAENPEQLRGPQYHLVWCIAKGTPVETERGPVPIEDVRVGDRVWTRKGLRRVTAATLTRRDAPIVTVATASGCRLRCTENHLVWTENRGWTPAGSLLRSDLLIEWGSLPFSLAVASVDRVERNGHTADVYDLAIEDAREFFASSVLVHNCDELAKFRHRQQETWDQIQFGLRLKTDPQPRAIITTTPQPTPTFKSILKDKRTIVQTGSTFDNAAHLDESYLETMKEKYEGTRLGRQELYAQLLDENEGSLWKPSYLRYQPLILEGVV